MKLYYSKGACSFAVRIVLNELKIPFEACAVDLQTKKTENGEDYLKINPKGPVPAIILDSGEFLTENQVILQYLADITPGQTLLAPSGELARYHVMEWLNYVATEMHKQLGALFNQAVTEDMKNAVYLPLVHARLAYLNAHLAKQDYLTGDSFNLPDAYLFVMLSWALLLKIPFEKYSHLQAFMKRMRERPAVKLSLEQER